MAVSTGKTGNAVDTLQLMFQSCAARDLLQQKNITSGVVENLNDSYGTCVYAHTHARGGEVVSSLLYSKPALTINLSLKGPEETSR